MKTVLCVAAAALSLLRSSTAQPEPKEASVEWLKANAAVIRTIDQADEDYADLAPLKAAIGSARIVMLGEQSHGDGATFRAKSRLAKFLHKEMGFTVLAWESGFFDCRFADEAFRAGKPASTAHENGIFGIWMLSQEAFPAVEYAAGTYGTDSPLLIAGIDSQFTSGKGQREFPAAIEKMITELGMNGSSVRTASESITGWIDEHMQKKSPDEPAEAIDVLRETVKRLDAPTHSEAAAPLAARAEVSRLLQNLLAYQKQLATAGGADWSESFNVRDQAMGETLIHLARVKYPGKKIIVWAASMHTMRNAPKVRLRNGPAYDTIFPMGDWAHATLGDEVYSIMFTAANGRAGIAWAGDWEIGAVKDNSLEDLLLRVGAPLLFLDFRGASQASEPGAAFLRQPFLARPLGYTWADGSWPQCFDGVFYTETMTRSTRRTSPERPSAPAESR